MEKRPPGKRLSSLFTSSTDSNINHGFPAPETSNPSSRDSSPAPSSNKLRRKSRELLKLSQPPQHLSPNVFPSSGSFHSLEPHGSRSPSGSRPGSRPSSRPPSPPEFALQPAPQLPGSAIAGRGRPTSRSGSPAGGLSPSLGPVDGVSPQGKLAKKRSWLGVRSRNSSSDANSQGAALRYQAWLIAHDQKINYDTATLENALPIPELWDDRGDAFIYLYPRASQKGPSFKVQSHIFASSPSLTYLAHGSYQSIVPRSSGEQQRVLPSGSGSQQPQNNSISRPTTSDSRSQDTLSEGSGRSRTLSDVADDVRQDVHLYFPIALKGQTVTGTKLSPEDMESVLEVRNLIAFLTRQQLVLSPKHHTYFSLLMGIADLLDIHKFSNIDGSTFGEVAAGSASFYVETLNLADLRTSREKTIEAIVLGERLRCIELYNEGFVHGVGKYEELIKLASPKFELITPRTRKRMDRAVLDLEIRLNSISIKLNTFDFPSVFTGLANSTTSSESKIIRFGEWRLAFQALRKHVLGYYKERMGAWPPKASSKKNDFEESGLNRLALVQLYHDFSDLYDLLADRASLTTRTSDTFGTVGGRDSPENDEPTPRALRTVLSEYDRSIPPVQPAIPFDTPLLPNLSMSRGSPLLDGKKLAKESKKRLKDDDIAQILRSSYNMDSLEPRARTAGQPGQMAPRSDFIACFMEFERRASHGRSLSDMRDQRNGFWIFMYAVLQSLPMLVISAPLIKFTRGCEYFLCEPPKGGVPWVKDRHGERKMNWYGIQGGTGVVNLPQDVVDLGVEGVYRRSHCWKVAEKWMGRPLDVPAQVPSFGFSPPPQFAAELPAAPGTPEIVEPEPTGMATPPVFDPNQRQSVALGLEELPLPPRVVPGAEATLVDRPRSAHDPNISFDDILAGVANQGKKKKGKK